MYGLYKYLEVCNDGEWFCLWKLDGHQNTIRFIRTLVLSVMYIMNVYHE